MDQLTRYVFFNFSRLMTVREHAAYKSILGQEKAQNTDAPGIKRMLETKWVSQDAEVLRLLEKGAEQFFLDVSHRILREHPNEVFLNYCPRCHGLARTPQARQCPHCFFSWHSEN